MEQYDMYAHYNYTNYTPYHYYGDFYEMYTDHLSQQKTVKTMETVSLVLVAIFIIVNFLILLTSIAPSARSRSAIWYMYHVDFVIVITGIIMTPLVSNHQIILENEYVCNLFMFLTKLLEGIRSASIVIVNIEFVFTALCPLQAFRKRPITRFFVTLAALWMFYCFLVAIFMMVRGYSPFGVFCMMFDMELEITLHVLKNWLPGLAVIGFTIAAIVLYVRIRIHGPRTYNNFPQSTGDVFRPTEFFVCLMIVNGLFLIMDVLIYEFHMNFGGSTGNMVSDMVIMIFHHLSMFLIPLAMLAFSDVRNVIRQAPLEAFRYLQDRFKGQSTEDPMDTQTLSMDSKDEHKV